MTLRTAMMAGLLLASAGTGWAAPAKGPVYDERPATITQSVAERDYDRRAVDIPMRDGVKLHTVIMVPKGAKGAAMLLTRTPYDAEDMTSLHGSPKMAVALDGYDSAPDVVIGGGYIRVVQDVRGKHGSEGTYVMNRPFVGTSLNPTKTDHATDTYDTIDWLVKHVPESNGRVGIIGISYDGFTALAALVNPHPALKVSVPMNPMVDGWRGDDWFHNGAFRQIGISYIWEQVATRGNASKYEVAEADAYTHYMKYGSAGALATAQGLDQIGFWQKLKAHQAWDSFWQEQAMDKVLAKAPLTVPTLLVHSLWDQEDIYGAPAVWKALKPQDKAGNLYMSIGPWYHGQAIERADTLGALKWDGDTGKWWRTNVLAPFLAHYLYDKPMDVPVVSAFRSGTNEWQKLAGWPASRAEKKLYLLPGEGLGFAPSAEAGTVDYVSDPAKPVTYYPRPNQQEGYDGNPWPTWLVGDQRPVSGRPDVLSFTGPVLTEAVTIAGAPVVHLTASTSGTDSDWVVKLIDVYPDAVPGDQAMGGYQLAVGMDIFRGRFRETLAEARPLKAGAALGYVFELPQANHVFLPGHRIMVQVQSSWFPLYDRNPQTFVPSIIDAKPGDYVKAVQKVSVGGAEGSYIALPVVE
ncbi:CocE/NonD family hydrolase [Novosphingobium sp. PASSN1]|uniref:CocE/NonD family hydrolase n=1 Tax=Novosphingobium sp. PASSN1 TaxID=2015561 RepID=UPI0025E13EAE|nr:CocE/NonD family hydrolase [Novosphingobium sp. PASSN1]